MPGRDGKVCRLERAAALLVDDVERADDAEVVEEVGVIARPPAAIDVGHERRSADRAEHEVTVPECHIPSRVPSVEREARRRLRDQCLDLSRLEAGCARRPVDVRSGGHEQVDRAIAEYLDADLGEDPE
jgi:hypothetical protein